MYADVADWFSGVEHPFLKDLIRFGWRALLVVATVLAVWLILRFVLRPLQRRLEDKTDDPAVASFLVNTLQVILIVGALLTVLNQVGVATTSLFAILGMAGLAIALSLKDSLSNFAAGLMVLSFNSVRAGDDIEVNGLRGRVVSVHSFHALLDTPQNRRVIVPNAMLINNPLTNYSANESRQIAWSLPLPAGADLERVKEGVLRTLDADSRVLKDPAPAVYVQEWAPQQWTLAVTLWAPTPLAEEVRQSLLEAVGRSAAEALAESE